MEWAKELQFIAQAGLTYTKDLFDKERFERIREISAEIMSLQSTLCRHPLTYDPELLLKGLALLYQMNAPQPHYAAGGRRRNPNNNFRRGRRPRSQRRERREEKNKNG